MKHRLPTFFAALALSVAASPALSAQSDPPRLPEPADPEALATQPARPTAEALQKAWPGRPILASALPNLLTMADVTGWPVHSQDDKRIGTLRDFVIDVQNGKIAYAIVGAGGVLGIGERKYAIPYSAIEVADGEENAFRTPITEERWNDAPQFDEDRLEALAEPDHRRELHAFFANRNAADEANAPATGEASRHALQDIGTPQLRLATRLTGGEIRNEDEVLGRVDAILLNLRDGDTFVRLGPDAPTVGTNDAFVLQFAQLDADPNERDRLLTSVTVEDLQQSRPTFTTDPAAKVTE